MSASRRHSLGKQRRQSAVATTEPFRGTRNGATGTVALPETADSESRIDVISSPAKDLWLFPSVLTIPITPGGALLAAEAL